jgi:hypothetical protein
LPSSSRSPPAFRLGSLGREPPGAVMESLAVAIPPTLPANNATITPDIVMPPSLTRTVPIACMSRKCDGPKEMAPQRCGAWCHVNRPFGATGVAILGWKTNLIRPLWKLGDRCHSDNRVVTIVGRRFSVPSIPRRNRPSFSSSKLSRQSDRSAQFHLPCCPSGWLQSGYRFHWCLSGGPRRCSQLQ